MGRVTRRTVIPGEKVIQIFDGIWIIFLYFLCLFVVMPSTFIETVVVVLNLSYFQQLL